jgi:beta-glucosidase
MYTIVNSGAYAGSENPVGGRSNMDKLFLKVNVISGVVIGAIALLVLVHYILKRKKKAAPVVE